MVPLTCLTTVTFFLSAILHTDAYASQLERESTGVRTHASEQQELLRPPFLEALRAADIRVDALEDILENSLLLGNGDIQALLYTEHGNLMLRLTKNDVWDARLDTSNDPPLPTLARLKELGHGEWQDRNWILPEGFELDGPDSYHAHPYPCPRACALVQLGDNPVRPSWRQIRAQGARNTWEYQENTAVMGIEGTAGASNGYAYTPLTWSTDTYSQLRLRLSGTGNARFYVDVMDTQGAILFASKWQETPTQTTEYTYDLPPGKTVGRLILYTWTEDGAHAENRFESLAFEGKDSRATVDFEVVTPPMCAAELDLHRAVATISGPVDGLPRTTVRALAQYNAFLIESDTAPRLIPIRSPDMPLAEQRERDEVTWLHQQIPGDLDWPGLSFAVAVASEGYRQSVAIVTSQESADPVTDAINLARKVVTEEPADIIQEHESAWEAFWAASGVVLDDALLQNTWYRNLYFLRCVTKPGVVSPGLFAGLVDDQPAWHGDYHTNYNIQQTFWTSYVTNHPELSEPYDRLITWYLPRARWLANHIFDCKGAFFPHVLFAYEPSDPEQCQSPNGRQYIHHVWGFTLGVTGLTVQPLWWHYKYVPNRDFLERVAYPAVHDAAVFYADFVEQCQRDANGKVVLEPSVSPEHWGWTPGFEHNRNGTFDIALIRMTLHAAMEGAEALGRDAELVERLQHVLGLLPSYPTTDDLDPVVVDVAGAPPITYNIAIPAVPVFPGDDITWWSSEGDKSLLARSIEQTQWNGNNSTIILGVARARLGLPDTWLWLREELAARLRPNGTFTLNRRGHTFNNFGHYTEQFAASMAVSELLLQSVEDVIRVFPAWPREKPASFRQLRAQGGFLVSASQRGGRIESVQVQSTIGGRLRLLSPWPNVRAQRREDTQPVTLTPDAVGILDLLTQAGEDWVFSRASTPAGK